MKKIENLTLENNVLNILYNTGDIEKYNIDDSLFKNEGNTILNNIKDKNDSQLGLIKNVDYSFRIKISPKLQKIFQTRNEYARLTMLIYIMILFEGVFFLCYPVAPLLFGTALIIPSAVILGTFTELFIELGIGLKDYLTKKHHKKIDNKIKVIKDYLEKQKIIDNVKDPEKQFIVIRNKKPTQEKISSLKFLKTELLFLKEDYGQDLDFNYDHKLVSESEHTLTFAKKF